MITSRIPPSRIIALCATLWVSACASLVTPAVNQQASALRPGAYALDQAHAAIIFRINHLGYSSYLGRFEKFTASLDFDADDPGAARIGAIIDMTSLDIANDDFAETLMGPQWFDAAAYPEARFDSTGITITGENSGTMAGNFTLHGITMPITLSVTFNGGARDFLRGNAYVVGFSAHTIIDRTQFGVSRLAGAIGNEVSIEIEAEFIRQ